MELTKASEKFKDHLNQKASSKNTVIAYSIDIDQLTGFLSTNGLLKLVEVEIKHLEDFIASLEKGNYTIKTISRKINSIKTFFKFLNDKGHLANNPSSQLKHRKFENKPPRILTKLEYRSLRDASKEDTRTLSMIELLLQTGIRISELSEIKTSDLHLEEDRPYLFVPEQNSIPARKIPLNKPAILAINSYLAEKPSVETPFLFSTKSGNQILIRNIRSSIDKYFKIIGLDDAKVNDLRHTFIYFQLQNGMDLKYLSEISGHKRVSTTEKYLNYLKDPKINTKEEVFGL